MHDDALRTIAAYQTSSLYRLQHAYELLTVDVDAYLAQEQQMSDDIGELAQKLQQLTETGQFPQNRSDMPQSAVTHGRPAPKTYPRIEILPVERLDEFAQSAKLALEQQGFDLKRDPLLQVLDAQQAWDIAASYHEKYGDVLWDDADYMVVTLAGVVGAILELLLVKLPGHSELLLSLPQGYAMTSWLAASFKHIQEELPETYDALRHDAAGASAGNWLWRFISVLLDLVRHSGTSVNEHGNIVTAQRFLPEQERLYATACLRIVCRTLSALFETVDIEAPFADIQLSLTDPASSWEDITTYAQAHGYRPVMFLREGVIPAAIEVFVQGYWFLRHYRNQEQLSAGRLKLTSMLALSHTLTISGHLVKSGLLFHIDPLSLNWSQMARCVPLLIAWIHEGLEREHTIRSALDDEWQRLYQRATSA